MFLIICVQKRKEYKIFMAHLGIFWLKICYHSLFSRTRLRTRTRCAGLETAYLRLRKFVNQRKTRKWPKTFTKSTVSLALVEGKICLGCQKNLYWPRILCFKNQKLRTLSLQTTAAVRMF